ncbi:hypothetical protein ABEB36_009150 [Hypothenemus hampei]|uniref:Uncharacterized protein n=1 Tax=Hypothenemus hampei TaxID=57062 RepID=A0ABD1ETA5_HYPHA
MDRQQRVVNDVAKSDILEEPRQKNCRQTTQYIQVKPLMVNTRPKRTKQVLALNKDKPNVAIGMCLPLGRIYSSLNLTRTQTSSCVKEQGKTRTHILGHCSKFRRNMIHGRQALNPET